MLIGFDLDDTLYKERDYVASGRRAVARAVISSTGLTWVEVEEAMNSGGNPFDSLDVWLRSRGICDWPVSRMVDVYRNHFPDLPVNTVMNGMLARLRDCGHKVVFITDGNSQRQLVKIKALGLEDVADAVFVSEDVGGNKLTGAGFMAAERMFPESSRLYIGDNPAKDFLWPNRNGWNTAMLLDTAGVNIHPQNMKQKEADAQARMRFFDLIDFLQTLICGPRYI